MEVRALGRSAWLLDNAILGLMAESVRRCCGHATLGGKDGTMEIVCGGIHAPCALAKLGCM